MPSSGGWLRIGGPKKKQGVRFGYLLHSGTEDIIALVIRNLDGAQELHPELVSPVAVFGKGCHVLRLLGDLNGIVGRKHTSGSCAHVIGFVPIVFCLQLNQQGVIHFQLKFVFMSRNKPVPKGMWY